MHAAMLGEAYTVLVRDGDVTRTRMRALFQSRGIDIAADVRFAECNRRLAAVPNEVRTE